LPWIFIEGNLNAMLPLEGKASRKKMAFHHSHKSPHPTVLDMKRFTVYDFSIGRGKFPGIYLLTSQKPFRKSKEV